MINNHYRATLNSSLNNFDTTFIKINSQVDVFKTLVCSSAVKKTATGAYLTKDPKQSDAETAQTKINEEWIHLSILGCFRLTIVT